MHGLLICREGENEELRIALRSWEKNAPWITDLTVVGSAPDWFEGNFIHLPQLKDRYTNTTKLLSVACKFSFLPERVVMLHDDMYAIKPTIECPNGNYGLIEEVIRDFQQRAIASNYLNGMINTLELLHRWGYEHPISYELHLPIEINRYTMSRVLSRIAQENIRIPHKRSIYGNVAHLGGTKMKDVKVSYNTDPWPTGAWLSTNYRSFSGPTEGKLRDLFPDPSKYEKV